MVRVAMIAGTAHAYADSSGMNAFPFNPIDRITRSAIRAARARYPESSSTPINRKSNSICGKNTSTDATPRHTPSISSDSTHPCPSSAPILPPPAFSTSPNASLSGCPIENTT